MQYVYFNVAIQFSYILCLLFVFSGICVSSYVICVTLFAFVT